MSVDGVNAKRSKEPRGGAKQGNEMNGRTSLATGGSIRTGHAGVGEWTALLVIYTAADVFLSYPSRVAEATAEAAWMVPLISGSLAALAYALIHLLMKRYPTNGLLDVVEKNLTPVASIAIGLLAVVYFLTQTALVMREFTETVIATVLPETPAAVVTVLFLAIIMYYAYKGLEGLTRVAVILSALLVVGLIILLVLPLTWFHAYLLTPVLGKGIGPIVLSGLSNTSMFVGVLVLAVLRPTVRNQRHTLRIGLLSSLLSAVIMSLVLLVFVGTFAVAVTGKVPFPMYQLARLIYVGRFVQRVESLFVFIWTAAAVIKMGMGLWIAAYLYARAFHMPIFRPLIMPMGMVLFVISFLPPDFTTVVQLSGDLLERFGWVITIVVPVLALGAATIVDKIRTKKSDQGSTDEQSGSHPFNGTSTDRARRRGGSKAK